MRSLPAIHPSVSCFRKLFQAQYSSDSLPKHRKKSIAGNKCWPDRHFSDRASTGRVSQGFGPRSLTSLTCTYLRRQKALPQCLPIPLFMAISPTEETFLYSEGVCHHLILVQTQPRLSGQPQTSEAESLTYHLRARAVPWQLSPPWRLMVSWRRLCPPAQEILQWKISSVQQLFPAPQGAR